MNPLIKLIILKTIISFTVIKIDDFNNKETTKL